MLKEPRLIARSYEPSRAKGELDLIGHDRDTLAIVEVRTRLAAKGRPALPEMSITRGMHEVLVRTANYFLRERHIQQCPVRFDVSSQSRPQPRIACPLQLNSTRRGETRLPVPVVFR
jgi:Holliday junction resolvase-like predicted endonuclease